MATIRDVTRGVVDGDRVQSQPRRAVNAEALDGGVLDVQALDAGRALEAVGIEELGLGLAAVGALAVPPLGTVAINDMARSTDNFDVAARDADERTAPLLVAEGGGALEGDGGAILQAGEIQSSTGRDGDVVQDDAGAGALALDGRGSIGEGARGPLSELSGGSGSEGGAGAEEESGGLDHFERLVRSTNEGLEREDAVERRK